MSQESSGIDTTQHNILPAHLKVYTCIEDTIRGYGHAPTVQEISEQVKLSFRYTYLVVRQLISMGYLTQNGFRKKRGLRIAAPLLNTSLKVEQHLEKNLT